MKKIIRAGATDQTLDIFIQNSSSTTGAGLTGLVYNSASLVCYYRKGATGSATALTLATQTVGGAHSDGGFVEIDATNMPGMYRLDLSDTIVNTAGSVSLMLKGATNMAPLPIELQVVSFNPEDAVRLGLTALPNANADAAGGLPISDAGGLDLDAKLANTNEVTAARMGALTDWINGGRLDLILDDILADTADMQPKLGTPAGASMSADIAAIKAAVDVIDDFVDSIPTDVWAHTVEGSYTAVQYLRIAIAALVGKLSGAATNEVSIRDTGDTKNRVVATVDADGNRSAVTLDGA